MQSLPQENCDFQWAYGPFTHLIILAFVPLLIWTVLGFGECKPIKKPLVCLGISVGMIIAGALGTVGQMMDVCEELARSSKFNLQDFVGGTYIALHPLWIGLACGGSLLVLNIISIATKLDGSNAIETVANDIGEK